MRPQFNWYRWTIAAVLAIVLLVTSACQTAQTSVPSAPIPPRLSPTPARPSAPLSPPAIDSERLFQHLQALDFERYTTSQRDRARTYLVQTLTKAGWTARSQRFDSGVNVVAERPGTDPNAGAILVVAHYDSVSGSPGADDNATSIATALEIARLLGPRSTPRTLRIALFDREEAGLLGSFAFTADAANLTNLLGVVNLEMLGYACRTAGCQKYPEGLPLTPPSDRGDFIGVIGDQEHLPLLEAFQTASRSVNLPVITLPIPFKGLFTPDVLRSDHAPFWAKNIGAVMVGDTANFRNPNYHQPTDTPDTIDRRFFTQSAQLVVNAVNLLLNSRQPMETSGRVTSVTP